jgi:hypothetical protein
MKKQTCYLWLVFLFFNPFILLAQDYFIPLNKEWNLRYEPYIQSLSSTVHTSIRPYRHDELAGNVNQDSLNAPILGDTRFSRTLIGRKLFKEHLLNIKDDDFIVLVDPLFEERIGREQNDNRTLYTNSRGFWVSGTAGKRFSFSTTFYENQAKFPSYMDTFISKYNIIPGEGRIKNQYGAYDYSNVTGTIAYTINRHFNVQFGHDKNFIGDGYRSLLLSDNANSYPFLKISTTFWKVKYMNLFTVMEDLQFPAPNDIAFKKKYASFHYLDLNIGKRISFGILESVVWSGDSSRGQGFDINYLNPFVFIRPVEFSLGSPDNMLLGFNLKVKIVPQVVFYSQLMLDEFKLSEIRSGRGWWANKQAFQLGLKSFDLPIKNFDLLTEFNYVRPFTYSHRTTFTNYAHFNQALAHPLGSNFYESVSIANYRYKNFLIRAEAMYALTATDTGNANLGNDIFKNYESYSLEYGNRIGQGLQNKIFYGEFRLSYLINPNTNLTFDVGYIYRRISNSTGIKETNWIFAGIRTALSNRYHDF